MRTRLSLIILLMTMSVQGQEWYSRWDQAGRTWNEKWTYMLDHIHDFPDSDRVDILGAAVRVGRDQLLSEEQKIVFNRAQTALLAIPGHAKYYQDKIEAMRLEVLANAKKSDDEILEMQSKDQEVVDEWSYSTYCGTVAFPTLGLMPSPEVVAVLGHFLNDPEGKRSISGHGELLAAGA